MSVSRRSILLGDRQHPPTRPLPVEGEGSACVTSPPAPDAQAVGGPRYRFGGFFGDRLVRAVAARFAEGAFGAGVPATLASNCASRRFGACDR